MKINKIIFKLIFMTALLLASPVNGQDTTAAIGEILSVENQVTIIRERGFRDQGEEELKAEVKLPVFAGDRIVTGEEGVVRFTINQSLFKLGSSSEMAVDDYSVIEDEEKQPVIHLIVGFLESVIKNKDGKPSLSEIHTPTAIAGVRGTEFDTVVSLDGTTMLAVDHGQVELDWEKSKAVVEKGKMAELNEDADNINHTDALPKHKRDWNQWQKEKEQNLAKNLPQMIIRHRKRFEKWSDLYKDSLARVKADHEQVAGTMANLKLAQERGDKKAVLRYSDQLKEHSKILRASIKQSRRHLNRTKTMTKHMAKIGNFADKNRHRFSKEDQAAIYSHMGFIREKGKHLKTESKKLVKDLRKTLKKARKFKIEKIKQWRNKRKL